MKVNWVIENFTKEVSYLEMAEAVKRQGHDLLELNGGYSKADLDPIRNTKAPVMFLGSIGMTRLIKEELAHLSPVAFCSFSNYLCQRYYPKYAHHGLLFNDNIVWTLACQFLAKKFFYYSIFAKEAILFVRPDSGEKPFQAQLLDLQDVDSFSKKVNPDEFIVLSSPKNIMGEWRFVVSNKPEIISYSCYRFQGQVTKVPGAPQGAIDKCWEVLKVGYYPDPVFVIDICEDSDGNYWLLELNSFSSAGLYACNKDKIVERVSEIACSHKNT